MRALLICLFFLLHSLAGQACSCASFPDTFCATLSGNETIIKARVIEKYEAGGDFPIPIMDVEVSAQYYGELPVADTISLVGQDGLNCNAPINGIVEGNALVIALAFGAYEDWGWGGISPNYETYDLFGCGVYFLFLNTDDEITGPIRPGQTAQPLDDFIGGLDECLLFSGWSDQAIFEDVTTFPNPFSEYLEIDNRSSLPLRLRLFNAQGQLLHTRSLNANERDRIPVDQLPSGVYWLEQEAALQRRVVKVIKL